MTGVVVAGVGHGAGAPHRRWEAGRRRYKTLITEAGRGEIRGDSPLAFKEGKGPPLRRRTGIHPGR